MAEWRREGCVVAQAGAATRITVDGLSWLIDAPVGSADLVRGANLQGIVFTSGRLDRVAGLLAVMEGHPQLDLWVPLADDRAALVGELAQQAWGCAPTLDAFTAGQGFAVGAGEGTLNALTSDTVSMGVRLVFEGIVVAYVARGTLDGAAKRLVRGADVVVLEPGAHGLTAGLALAGPADLLLPSGAVA
jgi:hypothetical protein